jgi:2-polyprenyl-3-methyl-5-hydroxy-6-metoxy-1,4-benzoquinol methylase
MVSDGRQVFFDHYIEHAFGAYEQSQTKIRDFECNYALVLPSDRSARILDIGIGRGEFLTLLTSRGHSNFLGIDISPDAVKFCQSIELPCTLVDDPLQYLTSRGQSFSFISMLDVLEHIPKNKALEYAMCVRNALTEGGTLLVQVPNMQSPDPALHRYNDMTHEIGFVEHSLTQLLQGAGFNRVEFFPFEPHGKGFRHGLKLFLRRLYHAEVRLRRRINGDLNPAILTPVFFAVARQV